MTLSERARRHLFSRWPVLLGGLAALATAGAWAFLPPRSQAGVVALLERRGGSVNADDYVWEPSRGWLDDLTHGRGVVFLAAASPGAPRDVFRARVNVTPWGRPLAARGFEQLSDSEYADEREPFVSRRYAAFTSVFNGRVQSVLIAQLGEGARVWRLALPKPAEHVALEIQNEHELVIEWEGRATAIELESTAVTGGVPLVVTEQPPCAAAAEAARSRGVTLLDAGPGARGDFPPKGYVGVAPLAKGRVPSIAHRKEGEVEAVAMDGRQLAFAVIPGTIAPRTATGFAFDGRLPEIAVGKHFVAALPIPTSLLRNASGALARRFWVSPLHADAIVVGDTGDGTLKIGRWALLPWELPDSSANVVEWAGRAESSGRHAVCVGQSGDLAVAWVKSDDDAVAVAALPSDCALSFSAPGTIDGAQWGENVAIDGLAASPLIVAWQVDTAPALALPSGMQWLPAQHGLPAPEFLPAIHEVEIPSLGVTVKVSYIDAQRFDWRLVAGADERAHRNKGSFPVELLAADQGRARVAFGLATGKRKKPRGLRIAGSVGHDFAHKEGVLLAGPGALTVAAGGSLPADLDASELPLTVSGGQLVRAAKERGPLQPRADLCALADGKILIAESIFDSHEVTAGVLARLGCQTAVALDRGTERDAWHLWGADAKGPFQTTALIGLERPLEGRVSPVPWQL